MREITNSEAALLQDVHRHGVVHFDYEPCGDGGRHAVCIHATLPAELQPRLHELALGAFLAESVGSVNEGRHLPITRTAYALTALGRHALGIRRPTPPRTRAGTVEVVGSTWGDD